MEKEYVISEKCVECKHSVHEHGMWLCINHKIDLEMVDATECEDFCRGITVDYQYRLNTCKNNLIDILNYSTIIDGESVEKTFLYHQVKNIVNSNFIWDKSDKNE